VTGSAAAVELVRGSRFDQEQRMGNTHDTEIARIEADYIHTRWRTNEDYRWGYTNERGTYVRQSVRPSVCLSGMVEVTTAFTDDEPQGLCGPVDMHYSVSGHRPTPIVTRDLFFYLPFDYTVGCTGLR